MALADLRCVPILFEQQETLLLMIWKQCLYVIGKGLLKEDQTEK